MADLACVRCEVTLTDANWYPSHRDRKPSPRKICKTCHYSGHKARNKMIKDNHPDLWDAHIEASYFRNIKYNYGLSREDFEVKWEAQARRCAICSSNKSTGRLGRFHVDHNHDTGEVRGILCQECNVLLANAREDITILDAAKEYLRFYNETPS